MASPLPTPAELGLKVGRVWATANGWDVRTPSARIIDDLAAHVPPVFLQTEAGVLNETVLQVWPGFLPDAKPIVIIASRLHESTWIHADR